MIKMLTTTHYNGKTYKHGEECTVDPATEKRWIKNGIAESTEGNDFDYSNDGESELLQSIDYTHMTDERLAEYAESIGVDISRCRSRESAEAKVRKAEQSGSFDFLGSKVNDFVGISAGHK